MKPENADLKWKQQLEEVVSLAQTDQFAAAVMAEEMLPSTESTYGAASKESMTLHHQLGILTMLLERYDEAEEHFLKAMETAESLPDAAIVEFADIARHLTLLYEAKARMR